MMSLPKVRRLFVTWLVVVAGSFVAQASDRPSSTIRWGKDVLRMDPPWYASADARAIAESVIQYQSPEGGWPKSTDLAAPPRLPSDIPRRGDGRANSIDNGATTTPVQYLAFVAHATGEVRYVQAFNRGIDFLIAAQYPNGGWPGYFPLRKGYYSHISYNDNAMINVLSLLRDVAAGRAPYEFVDPSQRKKAAAAVELGTECILRTQVVQNGKRTAWCAQHDPTTLAPAWARNFEPPSLSGDESVGIVRFLMQIEQPSPEEVAAVEAAINWLEAVAIHGVRLEEFKDADGNRDARVVPDPTAPPLWARFYELGTNKPIFLGRDKVVHYKLDEVERERRGGYDYYGTWAAKILDRDYARWRAKHDLQ